jgi:hypothetical protein
VENWQQAGQPTKGVGGPKAKRTQPGETCMTTQLYYLRSNHKRIVVGTKEDFATLEREPKAETGWFDLVPPRQAANWAEAKAVLLADFGQADAIG